MNTLEAVLEETSEKMKQEVRDMEDLIWLLEGMSKMSEGLE